MSFYTNKLEITVRKRRGGYYTPLNLARYLVKWGLRKETKRILEPSCGDGNFIVAVSEYLKRHSKTGTENPVEIVAVELVKDELEKAIKRVAQVDCTDAKLEWLHNDFFTAYTDLIKGDGFDLIIGNPPFIRFQYFEDESRELAFSHLRKADYKPTKLANAWAAFVQLGIELLRKGGCLAMIVPAELLQVKYAEPLRKRLATQFDRIVVISFEKLVFPEIQQEVLLLLAEGKKENNNTLSDIHTLHLRDGAELLDLDGLNDTVVHVPAKHTRNGMKWTSLFMDECSFKALDEAEHASGLIALGKLAQVDVGIVTGRNSYFILDHSQRQELQVSLLTIPIVGRTSALKSTCFNHGDFNNYVMRHPSYLLCLNGTDIIDFHEQLLRYIELGEQEGINCGYKCRIRKRWFDVPSIYTPDLFLFRQVHRYPLLVVNEIRATSTDTIHRVRVKTGVHAEKLAAIFFNSLTLAWAEVCGRSYGGGVLELEPSEAEELPIPYDSSIEIDVNKVDSLLRRGFPSEALDYVDNIVLKKHIGFDTAMIRNIRSGWEQLRDRRINRK